MTLMEQGWGAGITNGTVLLDFCFPTNMGESLIPAPRDSDCVTKRLLNRWKSAWRDMAWKQLCISKKQVLLRGGK